MKQRELVEEIPRLHSPIQAQNRFVTPRFSRIHSIILQLNYNFCTGNSFDSKFEQNHNAPSRIMQ